MFSCNLYVEHFNGSEWEAPKLVTAGLTTEDPNKKSKKHAALDATNSAPVTLYDGGKNPPHPVPYGSIVPKAIKEAFHVR